MPKLAHRAAVSLLCLCLLTAMQASALRHEPGRQPFGGLTSPPAAPSVFSIEPSDTGLKVRLSLSGRLADGRVLPFLPESVLVRSLETDASLSTWIVALNADGTLILDDMPAGTLNLTFSLVAGTLAGLPSEPVRLMAADPNEPNGSPDQSTPLTSAGGGVFMAEGMIDNSLDFDFYRLDLRAGDSASIGLAGLGGSGSALQPALSLLDSSGVVLDHSEDGSAVGIRAPGTGRFLVLVTDRAFLEGRAFQGAVDRFYRIEACRLNRRGDVDGDGRLSYRDAFLVFFLVRGVLDTLDYTPAQRVAADWDGDGVLAGDSQDFEGLLREIIPVPARNPDSPGAKSLTLLAAARDAEVFRFPDGSALRLGPDGRLDMATPGETALSLLALAESAMPHGMPQPNSAELCQNAPNPFNPSTRIQFSLSRPEAVSLDIFDLRGSRVAVLARSEYPAGTHAVQWSGRDDYGRVLPGGVYFYRLSAGGVVLTRKMVLLK